MLEDLFITDAIGEVSASDIELSEDIENWPMEIQNIIYSNIPVLTDFPGQLHFDNVDQDKLYAKGAYTIPIGQSEEEVITLPILVKSGKLLPIDMYIYQGKWHPMDMTDISSLTTRPELGLETIDDKDIPPLTHNNILNRITPPGGYNGMVTSVASKMGSLNRAVSDSLISEIKDTPFVIKKLATNKVARKKFLDILEAKEEKVAELTSDKVHGKTIFNGDRLIYAIGNGKFSIKSAALDSNYLVGIGHTECDGDALVTWLKEAELDYTRIFSDLKSKKMAATWNDNEDDKEEEFYQITKVGQYSCRASGTVAPIDMAAVGQITTIDGGSRVLLTDKQGNYTLQREVIGKQTSEEIGEIATQKADTCKQGQLISVPVSDTKDGLPVCTAPTKISNAVSMTIDNQPGVIYSGTSCMGKVAYIVTSEPTLKKPIKAKYVPEGTMIEKTATVWYVPAMLDVFNLSGNETPMIKNAFDLDSTLRLNGDSHSPVVSVKVWNIDNWNAGIKIGSSPAQIVPKTAAMLVMRKGGESKVFEKMAKLAGGDIHSFPLSFDHPGVSAYVDAKLAARGVRKARFNGELPKVNSTSTLKVASIMEDEEDIDTVLGLNYITPSNMEEFKASLSTMKETEESLTKLLMASRLGTMPVTEQDAKNVLTNLHGIIKALEGSM